MQWWWRRETPSTEVGSKAHKLKSTWLVSVNDGCFSYVSYRKHSWIVRRLLSLQDKERYVPWRLGVDRQAEHKNRGEHFCGRLKPKKLISLQNPVTRQTLLPVINRVNKLVLVRTSKPTRTFHCVRALQYAHAYYGKHCDKIRATRDTGRNLPPPFPPKKNAVMYVLYWL